MIDKKEYGGYLPLELAKGEPYYQTNAKYEVMALNSGRGAIICALKDFKPKKIYIPYYNCLSCTTAILNTDIDYQYYFIDHDMMPLDVKLKKDEILFWINYYGNASEQNINRIRQNYKNLIIDNTQAFFSEPIVDAYNCYSTRKFFGVNDGAYLIKNKINSKFYLDVDESHSRAIHLFKSIEQGTNAAYKESLDNENAINDTVLFMSGLTNNILRSIDYDRVKTKRKANLLMLHSYLSQFNKFNVNLESNTHIAYPFLYGKEEIRNYLIENRIYTPTWWKHVPEKCSYSQRETELTKYMSFIPIDQRYDTIDMKDMADIIISKIGKRMR